MQLKKKVRGCPLCGSRGKEHRRVTVINKQRKLVDAVTMTCDRHKGVVIWIEEDNSITDYSKEPDLGIPRDEILAHRQRVRRCNR
jgi:hypothetical protein